jgi:excisionase family DNA binding protein
MQGLNDMHAMGEDEREYMVAPEVAELLRMTPAWVYAQTRADKIPHVPLGRYFRYRRAAIDAWVLEIERGSIAAPQ